MSARQGSGVLAVAVTTLMRATSTVAIERDGFRRAAENVLDYRSAMQPAAGTVTASVAGFASLGLLDGGRGVAGTRSRVFVRRRRTIRAVEETLQTRTIAGRVVTNRPGAAELLGLKLGTVYAYSSPANRLAIGWPEPVGREDGQDWFVVEDLERFGRARAREPAAAPPVGDSGELIGVEEFAGLRGVTRDTFKRYVDLSRNAWNRGEDGYLPCPDEVSPAPVRGQRYRWRRDRAVAWSFPARRRTGGRSPGRRPQVADLRVVLAEAGPGEELTARELAVRLTDHLGVPVGLQAVWRLRRRLRAEGSRTG